MRRETSNTSTRLRSAGLEKTFGADAENMYKAEARFKNFAERIGRKTSADGSAYYSTTDCPIIHSSGCDNFDEDDAFTALIIKVVRCGVHFPENHIHLMCRSILRVFVVQSLLALPVCLTARRCGGRKANTWRRCTTSASSHRPRLRRRRHWYALILNIKQH